MNATGWPRPASRRSVAIRRPGCTASFGVPRQVAQPRGERVEVGDGERQPPEAVAVALDDLEQARAEDEELLRRRARPVVEALPHEPLGRGRQVGREQDDVVDRERAVGMLRRSGRRGAVVAQHPVEDAAALAGEPQLDAADDGRRSRRP